MISTTATWRATRRLLTNLALLVTGLAAGCEGEEQRSEPNQVGAAYDLLAGKVRECRRERDDCRNASDCSESALAACDEAKASCEEEARAAERALREATRECREAERACVDALSDDAGRDAREPCREQRKVCMDALRPPKPKCHVELEACLDEARAEEHEGDASVDPSGPGRKPRRHPESEAEVACHEQARACMEAEMDETPRPLPPRCPPPPKEPKPRDLDDGGRPTKPGHQRDDAGRSPKPHELDDAGRPVKPSHPPHERADGGRGLPAPMGDAGTNL